MIYGHPSADVYKVSNQPTFLDDLFTSLNALPVVDVKDESVKKQLEQVKEMHDSLAKDEFVLQRYRLFDKSIYQYIYNFNFINDDGIVAAYKSVVKSLFNDVVPLLYKLKLHYQCPRPFQLAALHKVALYPEVSASAQCPAFPSMHTCIGDVVSDVCSNTFPQAVKDLQALRDELPLSRLNMGLCLPADIEAGHQVALSILNSKEFKIKYKL